MKKYMLDVEYHDEFGITCVRDVIELENDEFAFEWARLELFGENVAYKATLFNEDGCVLAEFEKGGEKMKASELTREEHVLYAPWYGKLLMAVPCLALALLGSLSDIL